MNYIIRDDSLTVFINSQMFTVDNSHPNYNKIREMLKQYSHDKVDVSQEIMELYDIKKNIEEYGDGVISIEDGVVYANGMSLDNSLTKRMIRMMNEGFNVEPLKNFLSNLVKNPSNRSVQELYDFLDQNDLPITSDGHFLAYKSVTSDYKDRHTRKLDNSVGSIVTMPRNLVDDQKDRTCSTGLHFCSLGYLDFFHNSQSRIVVLKINPADVVSIPIDYNNSKGRCCRYEVVDDHDDHRKEKFDKTVNTSYDSCCDIGGCNCKDDVVSPILCGCRDASYCNDENCKVYKSHYPPTSDFSEIRDRVTVFIEDKMTEDDMHGHSDVITSFIDSFFEEIVDNYEWADMFIGHSDGYYPRVMLGDYNTGIDLFFEEILTCIINRLSEVWNEDYVDMNIQKWIDEINDDFG